MTTGAVAACARLAAIMVAALFARSSACAQAAAAAARDFQGYATVSALLANQSAHPGDRDLGGGAAFSFGIRWDPLPLALGLDFMASGWGSSSRKVRLDGNPASSATLVRSGYSVFYDAWLKLQPRLGNFVPYAEGIVGLKLQYADYTLSFDAGSGGTTLSETQRLNWTWGFGGGLQYIVGDTTSGGCAYVTLGLRWLRDGRHFPRLEDHLESSANAANELFSTRVAQLGFGMSGDLLSTEP